MTDFFCLQNRNVTFQVAPSRMDHTTGVREDKTQD